MMKNLKKLLLVFALAMFIFAPGVMAQVEDPVETVPEPRYDNTTEAPKEETFRAEVIRVVAEETDEGGEKYQDLILKGKTGEYKDKEISYPGLAQKISSKYLYEEGQVVFVSVTKTDQGELFIVTDRSRLPSIYWLAVIFVAIVLLVGRKHGLKAIISLALTFFVIIGLVVPRIISGADPVSTIVLFSIGIVIISMLVVYGWNKKSQIAISGMLVGILITMVISKLFTDFALLTGSHVEEVMFLKDYLGDKIDFRGLLLGSFILGSVGVLDDIAITQVSTTKELSEANSELGSVELYKKAMRVGVDHIASMINTLFLAYAGASFILLMLFGLKQAPFATLNDVLNNEIVATEIVRTLVGSIGLILTVPVTTLIAAYFYGKSKK